MSTDQKLVFREEFLNWLLLNKNFHAAADKKTPFYYEGLVDNISYCQNIFIDEQYYARFVMILHVGEKRLTPGEEQLFALFVHHLQQYFHKQTGLLGNSPSDILPRICHSLIVGEPVPPPLIKDTLNQAGWKLNHNYVLILLQVFEETGWKTQLVTTLSYLRNLLEKQWPQSCILTWEGKLLGIVNLTLSEHKKETDSQQVEEASGFLPFCKNLALFVRENVCKAGVSSVFQDFSRLQDGACQAPLP